MQFPIFHWITKAIPYTSFHHRRTVEYNSDFMHTLQISFRKQLEMFYIWHEFVQKNKNFLMDPTVTTSLQQFNHNVALKFQLYNSLFMHLPFQKIEKTGILLSLFLNQCEEGFENQKSPQQIIDAFFAGQDKYGTEQEKIDLLFRFIQFTERQIVLFDALEDASFAKINDLRGKGTLKNLQIQIEQSGREKELAEKLKNYSVQITLTAHPTQFYPPEILGIIFDLSRALNRNDTPQIDTYLQQLGKTPFFNKEKPTPFDEATSLIWFLENVFYEACGNIMVSLKNRFPEIVDTAKPILRMGFWPGGDRDGNPYVMYDTTLKVANALRGSILKCYYLQLRKMRRRLTFRGLEQLVDTLEEQIYNNIFIPGKITSINKEYILGILNIIYMICMVPVYFAIFAAHSNTKKIYASLAMIIFFVSMAIYISSSAAIPMYVLSGRYAAAQTESQRAFFAAAGEAVLVRGEDFTPGSFIGLIFGGVAALDMSLVMLRGGVFGKGTAWVGIIGFSSLSMFTICATFIPALYFVAFYGFGTIGGLLALLWFVLVARRLFQLGRQSNPA
jgi:hypothetical protein